MVNTGSFSITAEGLVSAQNTKKKQKYLKQRHLQVWMSVSKTQGQRILTVKVFVIDEIQPLTRRGDVALRF